MIGASIHEWIDRRMKSEMRQWKPNEEAETQSKWEKCVTPSNRNHRAEIWKNSFKKKCEYLINKRLRLCVFPLSSNCAHFTWTKQKSDWDVVHQWIFNFFFLFLSQASRVSASFLNFFSLRRKSKIDDKNANFVWLFYLFCFRFHFFSISLFGCEQKNRKSWQKLKVKQKNSVKWQQNFVGILCWFFFLFFFYFQTNWIKRRDDFALYLFHESFLF